MVNNLVVAMNEFGFNYINHFEKISKLLSFSILDAEGTPQIKTNDKYILVFDNSSYNETYVLDLVNDFIRLNPTRYNEVKKIYCDDAQTRRQIFAPSLTPDKYVNIKDLEHNYLFPAVMIINPQQNRVAVVQEQMQTMILTDNIKFLFGYLFQ